MSDLKSLAEQALALSEKVPSGEWYVIAQYGDQDIWNQDSGLLFRLTRGGDDLPEISELIAFSRSALPELAQYILDFEPSFALKDENAEFQRIATEAVNAELRMKSRLSEAEGKLELAKEALEQLQRMSACVTEDYHPWSCGDPKSRNPLYQCPVCKARETLAKLAGEPSGGEGK